MSERRLKRCILYLGGYDPVAPQRYFARFRREAERFRATWNVEFTATAETVSNDGTVWSTKLATHQDDWNVDTDFRLLAWDDIVKFDFARPLWRRLPLAFGVLADFVFSGTVWRYFASAWRFAIYFLYPYMIVACFLVISTGLAKLLDRDLALPLPLAVLAAAATFVGLMYWPGGRWYTTHLLDARTFMGQYLRKGRADMELRLDRFATELLSARRQGRYDEIIVVGHSQGSVFALEIVERALRLDPAAMREGIPTTVMSVGSCVLQLGLHPAAEEFRARVRTLAAEPSIRWTEFQALTDTVNFYKTDPAALMQLGEGTSRRFPLIHLVKIRDMLQPDDYRRIRNSLFRVHYQFVMGNTRQYSYDFFMICCGPELLARRFPEPNFPVLGAAG